MSGLGSTLQKLVQFCFGNTMFETLVDLMQKQSRINTYPKCTGSGLTSSHFTSNRASLGAWPLFSISIASPELFSELKTISCKIVSQLPNPIHELSRVVK